MEMLGSYFTIKLYFRNVPAERRIDEVNMLNALQKLIGTKRQEGVRK